MANHPRPFTATFEYDLERLGDYLLVEVTYGCDDGDVYLDSVRYDGQELPTTYAEDNEMLEEAKERLSEDMADAEADYGDYLYDLRRDERD